jgi:hypothetical protein
VTAFFKPGVTMSFVRLVPLVVGVFVVSALAAGPAGTETFTHDEQGWSATFPADWTRKKGADEHTTTFKAPADEEIDLFQENFAVTVHQQEGHVPIATAAEFIETMMTKLGARKIERTDGNVRLSGHDAIRFIWALQFGGLDLRLAQLVASVDDRIYVVTFTVEAGKARQFEAVGHAMFNHFRITG